MPPTPLKGSPRRVGVRRAPVRTDGASHTRSTTNIADGKSRPLCLAQEENAADTPKGVPSAGRRRRAPVRTDGASRTRSTTNRADGKSRPLCLAQRRGFEPPYVFPRNTISSRAHSTTLPSLRDLNILYHLPKKFKRFVRAKCNLLNFYI